MIREREHGTLPGLPMALLFFVVLCGTRLRADRQRRRRGWRRSSDRR